MNKFTIGNKIKIQTLKLIENIKFNQISHLFSPSISATSILGLSLSQSVQKSIAIKK